MSFERASVLPALGRQGSRRPFTRLLRTLLPRPKFGSLGVTTPGGEFFNFRGDIAGPDAAVTIRRWRCLWRLLAGGDVGFARSYIDGDWATPDLPRLLEWGLRNEETIASAKMAGLAAILARRLAHRRRANTKRGSRRNIAAHYDLGNEFYEKWLDRGMSYSSALFTSPQLSLEQAQDVKLDRIVSLLEIEGGESVLEIGFGWGGVVERLIAARGCHVTGLTLSSEQLAYARARIGRGGLATGADLRLQDYRDVEGQYDRIVSIEMLEAVGERYWPLFFDRLRACLKPGGTCVLQVITIAEDRFVSYRQRPDFIQSHIFPGGMLPTKARVRAAARTAGLTLTAEQSFGDSYTRTLQEWRRRFIAASQDIEALGFDVRFRRMWEYYLAYCEAGFLGRAIDVSLFQLRG